MTLSIIEDNCNTENTEAKEVVGLATRCHPLVPDWRVGLADCVDHVTTDW
jgi:hypothetical protein